MTDDPWVGPQHAPNQGDAVYVGWVDLMGIGDSMSRSYKSAATNIGKLYAVIANHEYIDGMDVYPMSDGMYLLSSELKELTTIMANVFHQFGKLTYERNNDDGDSYGPWLGFLIRGGIAHGTVYHGADFDEDGDSDIADIDWMENVPFGEPIANSHHVERGSAPYAIVVHESAHDDSGEWKWWKSHEDDIKDKIVGYLDAHFEWANNNIDDLLYEESNLHVHAHRAEDYFELEDGYFGFN